MYFLVSVHLIIFYYNENRLAIIEVVLSFINHLLSATLYHYFNIAKKTYRTSILTNKNKTKRTTKNIQITNKQNFHSAKNIPTYH